MARANDLANQPTSHSTESSRSPHQRVSFSQAKVQHLSKTIENMAENHLCSHMIITVQILRSTGCNAPFHQEAKGGSCLLGQPAHQAYAPLTQSGAEESDAIHANAPSNEENAMLQDANSESGIFPTIVYFPLKKVSQPLRLCSSDSERLLNALLACAPVASMFIVPSM
jgi:hypothetical protein